jgi:hypothetical protein
LHLQILKVFLCPMNEEQVINDDQAFTQIVHEHVPISFHLSCRDRERNEVIYDKFLCN